MAGKRIGIVIGNNYPEWDKERQLKFAVADAEKMKEILLNRDICGFDEVQYYPDRKSIEVSIAVDKTLRKADNDLVLFYFSGHGKKDHENKLCLLFNDTDEEALVTTSLSFDVINRCIKYPSKKSVVIILDCCYSGAAGIKDIDKDVTEDLNKLSGSGIVILTATGSMGNPTAREDEKLGHGIFTNYLIEGLEKGTADNNGDGLISIDELYDYAYKKTIENSNQFPKKEGSLEGNIYIGNNSTKVRDYEIEMYFRRLDNLKVNQILSLETHRELYDILLSIKSRKYEQSAKEITSALTENDKYTLKLFDAILKDNISPKEREFYIRKISEAEREEQDRPNLQTLSMVNKFFGYSGRSLPKL